MQYPSSQCLLPPKQQFFKPSPELRRLLLLQLLRESPRQSQAALARACGVTPGRINRYIESLHENELINVTSVNKRDLRYDLTEKGHELSGKLLDEYSSEVSRTYAFMRSMLVEKLTPVLEGKNLRVAVFGADATGEILLMALGHFPHVQLVALVDSSPSKIKKPLLGYMISSPECLSAILPDMIIVASWGMREQILESIAALALPESVQVITL